jgi:signal transduction histidine kinase
LNYETVLDLILEQIGLIVSHDTADIMLIEGGAARTFRRHGNRKGERQAGDNLTILNIADFPPLQTIYTTGQPLIIGNVTESAAWVSTPETSWIKSYMGVPIRARRRVIGFMNVNSATPDFFKEMDADRLQALAHQAGSAIENARLFQSVSKQSAQLRALSSRLAEVEEAERRQLARELHDQVGQNLTALSLNLKIVHDQLAAQQAKVTDEMAGPLIKRLADSLDLVEETTVRSRNVMDHLRPPALEEYGLLAALEWYVSGFQSRTDIDVALNGAEPQPRLPVAIETVLFRITQEAMTNVVRHAQAGQVNISLEVAADGVRLTIADNGVGFDTNSPEQAKKDERQHWGLLNMSERAYAVGGECRVESVPGEGTRVIVEIKSEP